MSGVIEDLPYGERVNIVKKIAAALVSILRDAGGAMELLDALRAAALKFKTMVSQIRYGLDYALSQRMVLLNDSTLAIA